MASRADVRWEAVDWRPYVATRRCGGATMRFVDAGSGPPVVLVHGLGGSWTSWMKNLPELTQDHRVIAVDLPGFGGSDPVRGTVGLEQVTAPLAELLLALDVSRAVVVGHSMGGLVVERLAIDHPDLVGALALLCTGGVPFRPVRRAVFVSALLGVNAVFRSRRRTAALLRIPGFRNAMLKGFVGDPSTVSPMLARRLLLGFGSSGYSASLRALTRADLRPELGRITCPTTVVCGGDDRVAPATFGPALASLLPNADFESWHGVGHCPMIEQPERFAALVRDLVHRRHVR